MTKRFNFSHDTPLLAPPTQEFETTPSRSPSRSRWLPFLSRRSNERKSSKSVSVQGTDDSANVEKQVSWRQESISVQKRSGSAVGFNSWFSKRRSSESPKSQFPFPVTSYSYTASTSPCELLFTPTVNRRSQTPIPNRATGVTEHSSPCGLYRRRPSPPPSPGDTVPITIYDPEESGQKKSERNIKSPVKKESRRRLSTDLLSPKDKKASQETTPGRSVSVAIDSSSSPCGSGDDTPQVKKGASVRFFGLGIRRTPIKSRRASDIYPEGKSL